jgi:hypothetical protein
MYPIGKDFPQNYPPPPPLLGCTAEDTEDTHIQK